MPDSATAARPVRCATRDVVGRGPDRYAVERVIVDQTAALDLLEVVAAQQLVHDDAQLVAVRLGRGDRVLLGGYRQRMTANANTGRSLGRRCRAGRSRPAGPAGSSAGRRMQVGGAGGGGTGRRKDCGRTHDPSQSPVHSLRTLRAMLEYVSSPIWHRCQQLITRRAGRVSQSVARGGQVRRPTSQCCVACRPRGGATRATSGLP